MPRLFTGLEIPQTQKQLLALAQCGLDTVRWIAPEDMHITLRFIGDVSAKVADTIVTELAAGDWPQPHIQLGELKAFGGNKPRSVSASVSDDPNLTRLQLKQESLLQQIGLPPEARKFTPHVTLARCRQTKTDQVAQYLGQFGGFSAPGFRPASFVLYSARDSVGGGPYHVEERFPFTTK